MKINKKSDSIIAIVISALLLVSMMSVLSPAIFNARAQSISKTSINPNLIDYNFAQGTGNASISLASNGPGPITPNILWTAHIPNVYGLTAYGQMCAFGGYVFITNASTGAVSHLLALDGGTGNLVYAIPYSGAPYYIGGNYMLLGSNCYTVDTGTLVWKGPAGFSQGLGLVNDPQYLPAPMLFGGNCGWKLTDPSQPPTVVWNGTGKAQVPSGTGSVYNNGVTVYAGANKQLLGFNASTGAFLWKSYVPATSYFTATNGVFITAAMNLAQLYGLNITTGDLLWQFDPGTIESGWSFNIGSSYGMVYAHNQDGHFYAVNATNGALVWDAYTNNGVGYSGFFTIAGGYIYAQMGDNQYVNPFTAEFGHSEFCCFDAYDGTLIWSLPFEVGAPATTQCNAYGNLYILPTSSQSKLGVYTYSTVNFDTSYNQVICIGPGLAQSWAQYMGDAAHNSDGQGPKHLAIAWSKPIGTSAPFASSPVFANGIGYIGSLNSNIYAFNASDGETLWNFTTKAPIQSTPAIVNGYVYTGADDGNVYCLNANSGNLVWSVGLSAGPATNLGFASAGTLGPPSPMVIGDKLYIGDNNYIYCLSTGSGAINWQYTWGKAKLIATPTIVNNIVYIAPNQGDAGSIYSPSTTEPNGFLYLLDAQTGALIKNITIPYAVNPFVAAGDPLGLKTFARGQGIHAPVTVDSAHNIAFVQQVCQRTFAVNLTSGKIIWTYDAYYNPGTPFQWGTNNNFGVLYASGNCYFNDYLSIACVDALTGNRTWITYLSRECNAPLSYFAGTVYASSYFNYVYALNAATGAKESYAYCGPGANQPVPYAGKLYVSSSAFNVTCYEEAVPLTIATTSITFELRPNSITKGDTTIVAGSINGINRAVAINVYFSKGDNSNPISISATTDDNGGFIVKFAPDMVGEWSVAVSWAGDDTHKASSSQIQILTVNELATPTPNQPVQSMADLYFIPAVAGLLAAIVVFGLATILLLRKKP